MTLLKNIVMALRIAVRDMRGGAASLRLLVAGVFVGAAAVALVGATSQSLVDGARKGGLESVGGDLSLRLFHRPPSEEELHSLRQEGKISITAEIRPSARAVKNGLGEGAALLVELKGIDQQYPLYGSVETQPRLNLYQSLDQEKGVYGAVAAPALFEALGLKFGDMVQIGDAQYQLRGKLVVEPDRAFRAFTLGPRLIVLSKTLPTTGLAEEGSDVYYYTHVKLPPKADVGAKAKAAMARIDQAFPQSGWRMVNAHEGVPGVERALSMAHVLLLFISLGVMLVGGAGISGAVRAHVSEKMGIVVILKSIGSPPGVVSLAIGFEVMAAAFVGAVLGVGLGAFGPALIATVLKEQLPFALDVIPSMKPLLAAGLFGVLVAALFAWWPLMGVQGMNPQVLLREHVAHPSGKMNLIEWLGAILIVSLLVALVFWVSPMPLLTVGFLVGALALAAFYYALGRGLSRLAKVLAKGKGANVRLALGNLYRPGAPTGPVVMALGLTLTVLVALEGISNAANRHVQEALPNSAPDIVAFSIKPEFATRLSDELRVSGLIERQRIMPFLHARVQAIGGVAVRDVKVPGSLNWVIRGDRGVSFSSNLPDGAVEYRKTFVRADTGNSESQFELGLMYSNGEGVVADETEALKWYRLAADNDHSGAMNNLAVILSNRGKSASILKEVTNLYRKAAKIGDEVAMYNFANRYFNGTGVKKNIKFGLKHMRNSAELGYVTAQFSLGRMYHTGEHGDANFGMAMHWYAAAANQDHSDAHFNLGEMHRDGQGTTISPKKAIEYFIEAAQSDADNSDYLAELYEEGKVIQADPVKAQKWREHAEKLRGLEDQDSPSKPRFKLTGRKSRRERLMEKRSHQVKGDELLS